jgi:hypothetical protein
MSLVADRLEEQQPHRQELHTALFTRRDDDDESRRTFEKEAAMHFEKLCMRVSVCLRLRHRAFVVAAPRTVRAKNCHR